MMSTLQITQQIDCFVKSFEICYYFVENLGIFYIICGKCYIPHPTKSFFAVTRTVVLELS